VSKFKFSLAAYSYRNLLTGKDAKLTLADFVDDCARMQLEGTEPTSYYFPDPVTPEYLRALKQQCFRLGLAISGTAIRNDFGHPPGQQRQQEIEHTKRWIEYAETLGAPVIRIFAGYVKEGSSAEEAHRLIVSGLEECCEHAGRHGVYLALENHGGPTATADGLLALVRDVQSPWFGVTLDTGNFRGEDVYGDLARIAPYALTVDRPGQSRRRWSEQSQRARRLPPFGPDSQGGWLPRLHRLGVRGRREPARSLPFAHRAAAGCFRGSVRAIQPPHPRPGLKKHRQLVRTGREESSRAFLRRSTGRCMSLARCDACYPW
jgi:hypothetical protein